MITVDQVVNAATSAGIELTQPEIWCRRITLCFDRRGAVFNQAIKRVALREDGRVEVFAVGDTADGKSYYTQHLGTP